MMTWHADALPMPCRQSLQGVKDHLRGLRAFRGLLQHVASHSGDELLQMPQAQHQNRRIVLLTLAQDGGVRSSQASLSSAITRRLRGAVNLTMVHSTHKDKPETLVTFDGSGEPIAAAVQESSVFRDRFTQI